MIRLQGLHKYFFHHKRNEIHVINDISLTFEDKGLVILLGPSGSGKTTLLNVIGGLDKVNKGSIAFDTTTISRYKPATWDQIRNRDIGYIFQNYYLLPDVTVYENIAMTLRMIGFTDEAEIDARITYLLERVHMQNYKKRKASQLSGGQQQRIAIVRALAKGPRVIIADEPTGNLDSKNSIEIMNIIKQISAETLVIMVTHEKALATHYADRIIELEDGRIIQDRKNTSLGALDHRAETNIYLGDMLKHAELLDNQVKFALYSDEEAIKANVKLVIKNGVLYLEVDSKHVQKVNVLTSLSEVKLVSGKKEGVQQVTKQRAYLLPAAKVDVKRSKKALSFKQSFRMAFNKVTQVSKGGKLLYLAFGLSAAILAITVSMLGSIYFENINHLLDLPQNTIEIRKAQIGDYTNLEEMLSQDFFDDVSLQGKQQPYTLSSPRLYQLSTPVDIYSHMRPSDDLATSDVLYGRLPQNMNEIAISEGLANRLLRDSSSRPLIRLMGVFDNKDYVGLDFYLPYRYTGTSTFVTGKIVGVIKEETPLSYMLRSGIPTVKSPFGIVDYYEDSLILKAGRMPEAPGEVLVPYFNQTDPFLSYPMMISGSPNKSHTVVGAYEIRDDFSSYNMVNTLLMLEEWYQEAFFLRMRPDDVLYLYANDMDAAKDYLNTLGVSFNVPYDDFHEDYFELFNRAMAPLITFAVVALLASALGIYFVIRSSMISRIYDIGVYRSLGISRFDIFKTFSFEIMIITTFSSLVGYGIMTYILHYLLSNTQDMFRGLFVSYSTILAGIAIMYLINLVSGALPIVMLLRHTPAEINSKYDL